VKVSENAAEEIVMDDRAKMSVASESTSGPLERYMSLLELVAAFPGELNATDVATGLKLPKSSVHRLLRVLGRSGLIEGGDTRDRSISLGRRLTRLIHASRQTDWIKAACLPHLAQAADNYADGRGYFLSCLSGHRVFVVASACSDPKWRSYTEAGDEIAPHAGSSAKMILSYQSDEIVGAALSSNLTAFTTETCTDPVLAKKKIREAKQLGYASCINEINDGMSALAVPIFLPDVGVIYSVAVTGPITKKIIHDRIALLEELRTLADTLTGVLSLEGRKKRPLAQRDLKASSSG
jgi:DNA-binding IclR family transcriptional regulator